MGLRDRWRLNLGDYLQTFKPAFDGCSRWTISVGTCAIVGLIRGLASTERGHQVVTVCPETVATGYRFPGQLVMILRTSLAWYK